MEERVIEIEGTQLKLPTGVVRLQGRTPGWQYVWRRGAQGGNRFFSDSQHGGPLEAFKMALKETLVNPRPKLEWRRGMAPGTKTIRWTDAEKRMVAEETFNQMLRGVGGLTECAEAAQALLLREGRLGRDRERKRHQLSKSMAPWLVDMIDEIREGRSNVRFMSPPVTLPNPDDPDVPDPDIPADPDIPDEPQEEPQEEPEETLPAAAVSKDAEEPQTPPRPAESIGKWIGATVAAGLQRPEVQEAVTTCLLAAFQQMIPALSDIVARAMPEPPPVPREIRRFVSDGEPVNPPREPTLLEVARGQVEVPRETRRFVSDGTAMALALRGAGIEPKPVEPTKPKRRVFVVGLNSHEIAEFERDFGKKLNITFAYENTSKEQIRAYSKSAEYCFSTMPHSGSPVDDIVKSNMTARGLKENYFRIPSNKKHLREQLAKLASGMQV